MERSAQKHQEGKDYNINVTKTLEKKGSVIKRAIYKRHKDPSRSKISMKWKVIQISSKHDFEPS